MVAAAAGWAQSYSVRAMPWNCGEKAAMRRGPRGPVVGRAECVLRCGHYVGEQASSSAADRSACQAVRRYGRSRSARGGLLLCSSEQCEVLLEGKARTERAWAWTQVPSHHTSALHTCPLGPLPVAAFSPQFHGIAWHGTHASRLSPSCCSCNHLNPPPAGMDGHQTSHSTPLLS